MVAILTIALFVLFLMHFSLQGRVNTLESKLRQKADVAPSQSRQSETFKAVPLRTMGEPVTPPVTAAADTPPPPVAPVTKSEAEMSFREKMAAKANPNQTGPISQTGFVPTHTPPTQPVSSAAPAGPSAIELWFKENTLIKVGAIIFFLGPVWFVSYAISKGWISPGARIALGLLLGITTLAIGHLRHAKNVEQYITLTSLGSSIVIASVYIGQNMFELFNPLVALILLLVAIVYTVFVSILTKKEWLCIASSIAALVAPLLINSPEPLAIPFFLYLSIITGGFLLVLSRQAWRVNPLVLVIGTGFYSLAYHGSNLITDEVLWIFVLIFTSMFYAATLVNMLRSQSVQALDITTIGITTVLFVGWVYDLIELKGLVTFAAALVTSLTGYLLYANGAERKISIVYAVLASFFTIVATSHTFDGYTLTLAYTLEVSMAIFLATKLNFSQTTINLACGLYAIPIISSLLTFNETSWQNGVLHESGYAFYTLVLASFALSSWLVYLSKQVNSPYHLSLAAIFTFVTYGYTIATAGLFWMGLLSNLNGIDPTYVDSLIPVLTYLSWLFVSVCLLVSVPILKLPSSWLRFGFVSLVPPLLASLGSLFSYDWNRGVTHPDSFGAFVVVFTLMALVGWFLALYRHNSNESGYKFGLGLHLVLFWGASTILVWQFWKGLMQVEDITIVVSYITWMFISYLLIQFVYKIKVSTSWVNTAFATITLPALVSLSSFTHSDWSNEWLHPNAAGLYAMTIIFMVLAISLNQEVKEKGEAVSYLKPLVKVLLSAFGLYSFVLVWLVSHAVIASDDSAVTVALFIYTVAGLVFYLMGKQTERKEFKLISGILLSAVVLRLGLVEVWTMEVFWRIITFMGIGGLFIITALIEKPFQPKEKEEEVIPPPQT